LLVCFDYDQDEMEGPPFSISKLELATHYSDTHELQLASSHDAADMLGADFELKENVWLLTRK
jgi:thiopurine S-methyltransferase